jgi:glycerol-3-phosphate dehydrogenase
MKKTTPLSLSFDVVLIGGGVAGLWILNRLCRAGYNAVLFEQAELGSGQTVASQGMIHGGVKYTLSGALSSASEAIADMPDYWRKCLNGEGDINLQQTKTLSDHFYMWSTESTFSKLTTFFASKALRGRIDTLDKTQRPAVFNSAQFKGNLYQLVDSVIDTPSLLANLAGNVHNRIFSINWNHSSLVEQNGSVELHITSSTNTNFVVSAQQFIFSAGKGNADLLKRINADKPEMQTRPLHQVMVKHKNNHLLYAHCIGSDSTPRLTISSHHCSDGDICWYLGGQLAEKGAGKAPQQLIREARHELEQLFPWLDWQTALWSTLPVERAEPKQANFARPDKAYIDRAYHADNKPFNNILVAWPTKLTLSPNLGNETLLLLDKLDIKPLQLNNDARHLDILAVPAIARSPWELTTWTTIT